MEAGKGGDGCLSFRREKYIEKGGPDGGDGGDGGSIYLVGDASLNTLVDFRYQPIYKAAKGEAGKGSDRTGAKGEDLLINVPCGTSVFDEDTDEYLGDVSEASQSLLVAAGGKHGLGNARFKTSTNRAPRQTKPGEPGELHNLRLELKLLADVGLLGMPNAGKSTLISRLSAAKPKIADYPFTTLVPNLGVVRQALGHSFVIADIPGLIAGAAEGAGLGVQFLKHLSRTRLLLHLLDLSPADGSDPVQNCRTLEAELAQYSHAIASKPRWIVFTKADLLPQAQVQQVAQGLAQQLGAQRYFTVSAVTGKGLDELVAEVGPCLEAMNAKEEEALLAEARQEVHEYSLRQREARRQRRQGQEPPEDTTDVQVHYEK